MSIDRASLEKRLRDSLENKETVEGRLYYFSDFLARKGLSGNWSAMTDFVPCVKDGDKLYIMKGTNILVQDTSGKRDTPTCYNCGSETLFKKVKVQTICAEGNFKRKDKMPYCGRCELEPKSAIIHYG